jgi:hypothetical protein
MAPTLHLRKRASRVVSAAVIFVIAVGVWLSPRDAGCQQGAATSVALDGRVVTITTPRWKVTIEEGVVTSLLDVPTGEALAGSTSHRPEARLGLGHLDEAGEDARKHHSPCGTFGLSETLPSQHRPGAKSVFSCQKSAKGAILTYRGLTNGTKDFPDETYVLSASVGDADGELILKVTGDSPKAGVFGVSITLANISATDRLYLPHFGGVVVDETWPQGEFSFQETGPYLAAPVVLGEGQKSAWAFWAEDARCTPKYLFLRNEASSRSVSWETLNLMPYEPKTRASSVEIHLNVFPGSWVAAATPYRKWFQATYAKPLSTRAPSWAKRIRVVVDGALPTDEAYVAALAKRFDPSTVLFHEWNLRAAKFDTELPDYTPNAEAPARIALLHKYGLKAMGYVNLYCVNSDSRVFQESKLRDFFLLRSKPFEPPNAWTKVGHGDILYGDPLSPKWRAFHARQMAELEERTHLDALYEDTAGTTFDFGNGEVEGLQAGQGGAAGIEEVREKCPGVAFATEFCSQPVAPLSLWPLRFNFIWNGPEFRERLSLIQRPVDTLLFGEDQRSWVPTTRAGSAQASHWAVDYADALGGLAQVRPGFANLAAAHGENAFLAERARLFSELQLRPVFPTTKWDRRVRCYYEDATGRRYSVVEDHGQAMLDPDGKAVYRRTRDADRVTDGTVIPGWPAYGEAGPIGLSPKLRYSSLRRERDPTRIQVESLPQGVFVRGYRERPSFTILALAPVDEGRTVTGEFRFRVNKACDELTIVGEQLQKPATDIEWKRTVTFPCSLLARYGPPVSPDAEGRLPFSDASLVYDGLGLEASSSDPLKAPFRLSLPDGSNELFAQVTPPADALHVLDYLVTVPNATTALRVVAQQAQTRFGNGTSARIEVGGVEVVNYKLPRDATFHEWLVPLGRFAGRCTVVTLTADPLSDSNGDQHRWSQPRLVDEPKQVLARRQIATQ